MYSILTKLRSPLPILPLPPLTFQTSYSSYIVLNPYQKELYRELQQFNSITVTPPRTAGTTTLLVLYTLEQILHNKIKKGIVYMSPDRMHIKQVYSDILQQNKILFKYKIPGLDQLEIQSCKIYLNPTWGNIIGVDLIIYDGLTISKELIKGTPHSRHIIVDYEPKQSIVEQLACNRQTGLPS